MYEFITFPYRYDGTLDSDVVVHEKARGGEETAWMDSYWWPKVILFSEILSLIINSGVKLIPPTINFHIRWTVFPAELPSSLWIYVIALLTCVADS